jgi:hypothetical protein
MTTNIHFSSYLAQLFLEWEMFQIKVVEKIKTNFMFNNCFLKSKTRFIFKKRFFEHRAVYEMMWKIWDMRIASWIPKTTNTHSEYVILIAFPLQQWLQESVSMLRYTCLVVTKITLHDYTVRDRIIVCFTRPGQTATLYTVLCAPVCISFVQSSQSLRV